MALEDRVDRLATALERMLDNGGFSNPAGGANAGGPDSASSRNLQTWNSGLTGLISSTGNLVRGNGNLLGIIEDVGKVIGHLSPLGGVLTNVFKGIASEVLIMNKNMMDSSKFGITFGQNLGMYSEKLAMAGIGQEQWTKLLQANSKYLSGAGMSAQEAADKFLKSSEVLMTTPEVVMARLSGIDFSEFQDQLLMNTDLLKYNNITSDKTQALLRDSTVQLTIEIDNMARITGKSRQEIQKGVDQTMRSNVIQLAKMSMDAEELVRYQKSAVTIDQYGKGVAELFAEMSANRGDIVDKDTGAIMAGLESFAPKAAQALRAASIETDAQKKADLVKEFEFRMAEAAANKENMRQLQAFAKTQDPAIRSLVATIVESQPLMATNVQAIRAMNGNASLEGFMAQRERTIAENRRIREATLNGTDPNNQLSVAVNAAQDGVKTLSAGLAQGLRKMIDSANADIAKLGLDYRKAYLAGELSPEELDKKLKGTIGYSGDDTTKRDNAPQGPEFKWNKNNPPLPVTIVDPTLTRQALGSKDVFGDWFAKDWGSGGLNIMDGKEAAVPEGKVGEFINDMIGKNPNLLAGLQGNLRNALMEGNSAASIQRAIEKMLDMQSPMQLPSTISSASSVGAVGTIVEDKTTSDLHAAIEKLNTKMDKLITAVEDGANANVKAVNSQGNLIA